MPQELFITQCTTCRARLKVHDQDAIGQILSCPKCGSMVQVVPPPDWKPPVAAAAGAAVPAHAGSSAANNPATAKPVATPKLTPTASSLGVPNVVAKAPAAQAAPNLATAPVLPKASVPKPPAPPQLPPPAPALPRASGASGVISVSNSAATALKQPTSVAVATAAPPVVPPPLASEVVTPPATASVGRLSVITARLRQDWWMLAGGFAAGIVVGVSIWLALGNRASHVDQDESPIAAVGHDATEAPDQSPVEVAADPPNENGNAANPVEQPDQTANKPVDEVPLKPFPSKENSPELADPEQNENGDVAVEDPAPADGAAVPADEADPAMTDAAADKPGGDDADLLGGQLALPQDVPPPARSPVAIEDPEPADKEASAMQAEATKAPAAAAAETTQQEQTGERLASVLPPVDFKQVPLNKFVAFIKQYTTLKISIDRAALQKAGIDPKVPVTVQRANTTVAQALRDALGPLGLTYRQDEDELVITVGKRGNR